MTGSQSKMTQDKEWQKNPKVEVQYSGENSFMAEKILLEFNNDDGVFLIEYDDKAERMMARFLNQSPKIEGTAQECEHWVLEKKDIESGNYKFKIVIGQTLWRFQRIMKQIEVTEIRGIMRRITSNQIVYEYAAPLSKVSKIEIVNLPPR
jgi:hypothetical protein